MTDDERELYEENAAKYEYEAGFSREQAEKEAELDVISRRLQLKATGRK